MRGEGEFTPEKKEEIMRDVLEQASKDQFLTVEENKTLQIMKMSNEIKRLKQEAIMDMQTIKDASYIIKDALDDHMTTVAQRSILYIVRIADKYINAPSDI